ncbi:MAG TPA: 1-deoxy-D-xylulose-5-phosphate synthase [Firmicutes bacterium]|jgi:1-deoxy-D-xylulose-5-phosphate synthase|nr:1-deoxy-D-xylulose-5-phosphate synthase [Bacillota bacterium]
MADILDNLKGPADLKGLSDAQLTELAAELRQLLLTTVARTGGHLAPNLGVVELTLALHASFNSPYDQIVWDVGHQSYVHKILTGRLAEFSTLRQYNGLSGFPKPEESEHDAFATGHSSTSISAALGLAKARDLRGEHNKVVAVIGDGSLTGGMAFEAMNHLGHLQTDLIIVLNDNEMSISKNVGALARYLTRLRMNPRLRRLKYDLQDLIERIPRVGQATIRYLEKIEDSLKFLVIPGMFFEELGISYLGPINGHDIAELKMSFRNACQREGPVLIHVLTTKGKGYRLAESNPQKFHGTGPFDLETGKKIGSSGNPSFTEIFGETILDLAAKDWRIVAITAAMTDGTGLVDFAKQFPDRFFDVGIAEQHAVTMAAGLAKKGLRPIVAIYSTFLQRAYDQIIHDVCFQNLPVLFMLDRAGLVGPDGPTHHGVFDLSFLRQIPNLVVMAPADENELRDMIYTALQYKGPVAIRYPKCECLHISGENEYHLLPIGKGTIKVAGRGVAIVAVGSMLSNALSAAIRLNKSGIQCTVVNACFIKPLDEELIANLAGQHQNLIIIEENIIAGGFGSAVLEFIAGHRIKEFINIKLMGIPDHFVTQGPRELLLQQCGLDVDGICRAIYELNLPTVGVRVRR